MSNAVQYLFKVAVEPQTTEVYKKVKNNLDTYVLEKKYKGERIEFSQSNQLGLSFYVLEKERVKLIIWLLNPEKKCMRDSFNSGATVKVNIYSNSGLEQKLSTAKDLQDLILENLKERGMI